jgi:hypothetical protein
LHTEIRFWNVYLTREWVKETKREREREAHIHRHSVPNWTHLQFKYLLPCVGMAKLWSFPSLQYGAHMRTHTHLHVDTNDHTCTWDLKGLHNTAPFWATVKSKAVSMHAVRCARENRPNIDIRWGLSGRLYHPAVYSYRCTLNLRVGGPQSRSEHYGNQKNLFQIPGIEPWFPGRPAPSLFTIPMPSSAPVEIQLVIMYTN